MTRPVSKEQREQFTSHDVAHMLSVSVRTFWRLVAAGKFPAGIKYNRKLVRWDRQTVVAWLEKKRKEAAGEAP